MTEFACSTTISAILRKTLDNKTIINKLLTSPPDFNLNTKIQAQQFVDQDENPINPNIYSDIEEISIEEKDIDDVNYMMLLDALNNPLEYLRRITFDLVRLLLIPTDTVHTKQINVNQVFTNAKKVCIAIQVFCSLGHKSSDVSLFHSILIVNKPFVRLLIETVDGYNTLKTQIQDVITIPKEQQAEITKRVDNAEPEIPLSETEIKSIRSASIVELINIETEDLIFNLDVFFARLDRILKIIQNHKISSDSTMVERINSKIKELVDATGLNYEIDKAVTNFKENKQSEEDTLKIVKTQDEITTELNNIRLRMFLLDQYDDLFCDGKPSKGGKRNKTKKYRRTKSTNHINKKRIGRRKTKKYHKKVFRQSKM